jgi:nucleoid-associated protein YgaU
MGFRRVLPLVVWIGALAAVIAGFSALGDGRLAGPALATPSTWGDWAAGRDPVIAVTALLRVVVVGLAWYLLATTVIGALARATRSVRMVRWADALALPPVRHVLTSSLGLTTALVTAAGPAVALPPPGLVPPRASDPPVMAPLDLPAPSLTASEPAAEATPEATPTPEPTADPTPAAPPSPEPTAEPVQAAPTPGAPAEHVTRPGDHFWRIAEAQVAAAVGRPATDAEIAPYWRDLVAANRDRLADPDNPDLVFPGQQFVLPPVRRR